MVARPLSMKRYIESQQPELELIDDVEEESSGNNS